MLTRRNALKIAAVLGASREVVPDVSRVDAIRGFDLNAEVPDLPEQISVAEDLHSPINFAENGNA
jgi:hypothetical protein